MQELNNNKKPSKYSILKHKWSNKCKLENCDAPVYYCPTCREKHGLNIKGHLVRHLGTKRNILEREVIYSIAHAHFCDDIDQGRNINCQLERKMEPKKGNVKVVDKLIDDDRKFPGWLSDYLDGDGR